MNKKKISIIFTNILMGCFGLVLGGLMGYFMVSEDSLFSILLNLLLLAIFFISQLIMHEGGHLLFGLLTGYKFLSFRIFNILFKKENDKIVIRKYSLAGTAGQCLLKPPVLVNDTIPFFWYNAGGVIVNLISAVLCLGLFFMTHNTQCLSLAVCGLYCGLTNGIPINNGQVANDGYNILSMIRDKSAIKAFWIQLYVNQLQMEGNRLRDISEEYVYMPTTEQSKNVLHSSVGVFYCSRLMSMLKYEEAEKAILEAKKFECGLGLNESLLNCDLITCMILRHADKDEIEKIYDKKQKKFHKAMGSYPAILRVEYALHKFVYNDDKKASEILNSFEKVAKTYPYTSDLEDERDHLKMLEEKGEIYA